MDDTTRRVDGAQDRAEGDEVTPRTAQIREEIAQTRDELTETIDAIQEKLSPGHIVARATERVKSATTERVRDMAETASDTAQTMMEYGRQTTDRMAGRMGQNPIPAAMIGVGAAWLLLNRAQSHRQVSRWARGESARFDYGANTGMTSSNMLPVAIAAVGLAWLGSCRKKSRIVVPR
jgi:cell division septum initiation protein DivIVA